MEDFSSLIRMNITQVEFDEKLDSCIREWLSIRWDRAILIMNYLSPQRDGLLKILEKARKWSEITSEEGAKGYFELIKYVKWRCRVLWIRI